MWCSLRGCILLLHDSCSFFLQYFFWHCRSFNGHDVIIKKNELNNKLYSYEVVVSNHSSESVYPLEFSYIFFVSYLAVNFE